jgi:DNA-binding HxlR family transcriptional regulator
MHNPKSYRLNLWQPATSASDRENEMPSLEEIRIEKQQARFEKVALDAQISKAIKASEVLADQLRQLEKKQSMTKQTSPMKPSMDAYLGIGQADDEDLPIIRQLRQSSAKEVIFRWLSGRG